MEIVIHADAKLNASNEKGQGVLNISFLCCNQIFIYVFKEGVFPSLQSYKM